jgi:hypothetical protein
VQNVLGDGLLAGPGDHVMIDLHMPRGFVSEWPSIRQLCSISDEARRMFRLPVSKRPPLPPASYWEVDQELAAHDSEYYEEWWHWRERTVSALHPHVAAPGRGLPDLRPDIGTHEGIKIDCTTVNLLITVPQSARPQVLKVGWKIRRNPRGLLDFEDFHCDLAFRLSLECRQLWPDPLPYHVCSTLERQGTRPGEEELAALTERAMDRLARRNALNGADANEVECRHCQPLAASQVPDIASHPLADLLSPLGTGGLILTSSPGESEGEDSEQNTIFPGSAACRPACSLCFGEEPESPVLEVRSQLAESDAASCDQPSSSPMSTPSPSSLVYSPAAGKEVLFRYGLDATNQVVASVSMLVSVCSHAEDGSTLAAPGSSDGCVGMEHVS